MKKSIALFLALAMIFSFSTLVFAKSEAKSGAEDFASTTPDLNVAAESAVLMEVRTSSK